jgi:hypothetical protein
MNEDKEKLRLDRNLIKKEKKPSKFKKFAGSSVINYMLLGAILVAVTYAFGYHQGSKLPEPTPANSICRKFATEVPLYYKAQTGAIFGEKPPTGSLNKEQLDALAKDCDENINVYTYINPTETVPTTKVVKK